MLVCRFDRVCPCYALIPNVALIVKPKKDKSGFFAARQIGIHFEWLSFCATFIWLY
jgi:hypothetical protein